MKYSVQYYSSLSVDFMVPFVGFSDNKQLIMISCSHYQSILLRSCRKVNVCSAANHVFGLLLGHDLLL